MTTVRTILYLPAFFLLIIGCKQHYEPPAIQKGVSFLVVDGFLNNSSDTTFIHLSRTQKIADGTFNSQEGGAQLTIEDISGTPLYYFKELKDTGTYIVPGMNLNVNNKYIFRIITASAKQYISDQLQVIKTPPIDSISWEKTGEGVTIYANTHDPSDSIKYYRWDYSETWHYRSAYVSGLVFKNGAFVDRTPAEYVFECWRTQKSTQLLLSSTVRLSENIIYHFPVRQIDQNALELSLKYFILLKQYALTKEAFEYMENLKKITEQTGSIFDSQPLQLIGNMHIVGNSGETVLGYLTISTQETSNIYITNEEVKPWEYPTRCIEIKVPILKTGAYFPNQGYVPLRREGFGPAEVIIVADRVCGDCTALGGVTTKPDFWQ